MTATNDIHSKIKQAEDTIKSLLLDGTGCFVSSSFGKDSSVITSLTLNVAASLSADGVTLPPIAILHSNTGIENPEVHNYAMEEIEKVKTFAEKNNFNVIIKIAEPYLASSWAFRTIGTGKLPTFTNANTRDCSVDFKSIPLTRANKQIVRELKAISQSDCEPVSIIGTRHEESASRSSRMTKRGESDTQVWTGKNGGKFLSPIMSWSTKDVWRYLNLFVERERTTYSDFENTYRIYEDATDVNATCAIEADLAFGKANNSSACGSRHGCAFCTAVGEDKSMRNMLENDEDYHYMIGLNNLQRFLLATQFDFNRREWLGRTINKMGFMATGPDTYSARMREELLRYVLTLQIEELEASQELGLDEPRFNLITLEQIVAIDAEWSKQGLFGGFHGLKIYRDIFRDGERYPIPEITPFERQPIPAKRYIKTGLEWDSEFNYAFTGLYTPNVDEHCPEQELHRDTSFTVDSEAIDFIMMDMDYLIEKYHNNPNYRITASFQHYLGLGTLTFAKNQLTMVDEILRRTAFREDNGLTGADIDIKALLTKAISKKEMHIITGKTVIENAIKAITDKSDIREPVTGFNIIMHFFKSKAKVAKKSYSTPIQLDIFAA